MSFLQARVKLERAGGGLDVDLALGEGITALFGPSGAGKTTLLHCVAGLVTPTDGRIVLDGEPLFDRAAGVNVPPERRRVGVVFQDLRLFPHMTVRENLFFGHVTGGAVTRERVVDVLGLGDLLERRPDALSGGEARRVAFGRALLQSPRLLLLDEPTAGLDEKRKNRVLQLLGQVRAEFGLPMLFVSHALPEILQLTTEVAVLDGGFVLGQGQLHDVLGSERVFRLADALGLESVLEVEIAGTDVEAGTTRVRMGATEFLAPPVDRPQGTRALIAVRPEDVILARAPVQGISAQNAVAGTVSRVVALSDRLLVSVDVGNGAVLRAEITPRSRQQLGVEPGARIFCLVKVLSFRWRRFL